MRKYVFGLTDTISHIRAKFDIIYWKIALVAQLLIRRKKLLSVANSLLWRFDCILPSAKGLVPSPFHQHAFQEQELHEQNSIHIITQLQAAMIHGH